MKKTFKIVSVICLFIAIALFGITACVSGGSHVHTEVIDQSVPPTCTEPGLTRGSHCSVCNEIIVEQKPLKALGHSVIIDHGYDPTCVDYGLKQGKHCSVCNEVLLEQEIIPALGHTVVIDEAVASTCVKSGLTEGKHCSCCGKTLVKQQSVPATGHTETVIEAVEPTCTENGLTEGKCCSVCGEVLIAQNVVPKRGHVYGEWNVIKQPTESEAGTKRRDCANCDAFETDIVAELSHDHSKWSTIVLEAVDPTCTETGLTEGKKCSKCGEILVAQKTVTAKGHSYKSVDVDPTCTEKGYTRYTCDCGDSYTDYRDALGHTEVVDASVAPTCDTPGLTAGKHCSVCGEILTPQQTVGALGHSVVIDSALNATCTESGCTEGKHCSTCGKVLVSQTVIDPFGHVYVLRQVQGTSGIYASMCSRCSELEDISVITYEKYGAVGDGVTDDAAAIRKAHDAANYYGLPVEATAGATYYIGTISKTITIKTDTDWKGASFIFDDSGIRWNNSSLRGINVFTIASDVAAKSVTVSSGFSLSKGQTNVGMTFDAPCMLKIENSNRKIYIRYGENANSGTNLSEYILVDENGNVDPSTPIQYDYTTVTKITRYSVNDTPISVGNGKITTMVPDPKEQDPTYENNYCYYARGIYVSRSNTTLYGIEHRIQGEDMTVETDRNGDGVIDKWGADKSYGVPYSGFFNFNNAYNIKMQDCLVQGHQAYSFYNESGARNEMGSYDINATGCIALQFLGIDQYENEATGEVITNRFMYHGIMGSNFCRNVVMDDCYLDRFDSHQALHNARITNSTLGFGILVIGGGELYIENVYRIKEGAFIHLRGDYNSVFDGNVIIKNSRMGSGMNTVINGTWRSFYNGLPNHMTTSLTIDGLTVESYKIYLYDISGANTSAPTDSVNPLILPEYVKVNGVKMLIGLSAKVEASKRSDAFAAITVTK